RAPSGTRTTPGCATRPDTLTTSTRPAGPVAVKPAVTSGAAPAARPPPAPDDPFPGPEAGAPLVPLPEAYAPPSPPPAPSTTTPGSPRTGSACGRAVHTPTAAMTAARAATSTSAVAPGRPGSRRAPRHEARSNHRERRVARRFGNGIVGGPTTTASSAVSASV